MKRTPLLITSGIVLLIAGGYFLYEKVLKHDPVRPWDLVPAEAIVVYEKNSCNSCVQDLQKASLWKVVERVVTFKKPNDSIRSKIGEMLQSLQGFLISVHVTKRDDFDVVYYIPAGTEIIKSLQLLKKGEYRLTAREFSTVRIEELKFSNQTFSFAQIEGVWIGSFTPFLVEDVIRTFKSQAAPFKSGVNDRSFSSIQDDGGNLYIQLRNFSEIFSVFAVDHPLQSLSLGKAALLDIKTEDDAMVLNGFSADSVGQSDQMLSVFRHQSPVSFGLKHLVPNRALVVTSYGVSDGATFAGDLREFVSRKHPALRDTLNRLTTANNFGIEKLYPLLSDEFAVCSFESSKRRSLTKVVLIETKQPSQWLSVFQKISVRLSVDTVFYERYAEHEIREIPVFRFPEKLLWPFVTGFEQSFYTSIGNVMIIADNLEELKNFLDDIEAEDTWGKSVAKNRFLESTLLESNISLYLNPSRAWNLLGRSLQPRWQTFVKENQTLLKSLQMSSIQFSHLNNNYYTNALFTYKPYTPVSNPSAAPTNQIVAHMERDIMNIHAVRSHVSRGNEILLQDSLNDLSLISADGKVLWKLPIGDRIVGDVSQVDFFNNGKLQYLFSTQNAIHIIDRLGNYVDPYPRFLPAIDIEYLSVIDYDNSKKYRFLVADKKGNLWMYDKEGNALDGWRPKDVGGSLAMAPRHHRIKGKDYILAIRRDGQVYLMNRRGENLKKIPMDSETIPLGDYFLETGNSLSNTYFVVISRDGFRVKFNPEGKLQSRETLPKTSINSIFSLVNEKSAKSYMVLEQDGKQLNLTDDSGKKIVASGFGNVSPADIRYFDFGAGKVFIVVKDRTQGFSYVYDGEGNLLTTPPLESTIVEIRPFNSEQFRLFFAQGRSLIIQPL